MTNQEPIESTLTRLKDVVSLRTHEKKAGRAHLQAFMQKSRKPVVSPYTKLFAPSLRFASAFMLFILIGGTGVVSASGKAQPGNPLYIVKLKVAEPTYSALIFNPEEKTAFEVERTDRRLKELALVARSENPDPETTALIASALTESINDITEDITDFTTTGNNDEALEANTDLQSVLAAHQRVLAVIEEQYPLLSADFDAVSDSVDRSLAATENIEQDIEDAVKNTGTDEPSLSKQEKKTEALRTELANQLTRDALVLDARDQEIVTEALTEIDTILGEAREAREDEDRAESYLLYTEANQRLLELQTLIEADRDLGIGVIDTDESELEILEQ